MPLYKEQGIVLRSHKLGEADKIVTILTQGSGKVRAVAKGIRKTRSRFGARLEPLTHVSLLLYRGRSLDTVTQAEILSSFRTLRTGFDLIAAVSDQLPQLDASFVVLGTGEPRYQTMWSSLAAAYPEKIGARIGFDETLAHLIEAGADMFLMPSQFEPCGLNQMYSMRYGTVPIVRAVGGLADTVTPETGFSFQDYSPAALAGALGDALTAYAQPRFWRALQVAGMRQDFSWDRSAKEYVKIYDRALRRA